MPVTSSPVWNGAQAGLVGNAGATAASAQVNQLLGTHPDTNLYQGNSILTPNGTGGAAAVRQFSTQDIDQPFTMSGTVIGRVAIPLFAVGDGADLVVSLCADNGSGQPGTMITQTRIPANWITQLGAVSVLPVPAAQTSGITTGYTGNPLAVAQFNGFRMGAFKNISWPFPTTGTGGANTTTVSTYIGNSIIIAGGTAGGVATSSVYTITYDTRGNLAQAIPQQALPAASDGSSVMTVSTDPSSGSLTVVFTGGATTAGGSPVSSVYAASLDSTTGDIASWSLQAALPTAIQNHAMASYNGYVYTIAGGTGGGGTTTAVNYAQVSNGQISAWTATTPLPPQVTNPVYNWAAVSNGCLFVFGGWNGSVGQTECVYAAINANGSLGPWIPGPTLPAGAYVTDGIPALSGESYGLIATTGATLFMLGVSEAGPDATWQTADYLGTGVLLGLADAGGGLFQFYGLVGQEYTSMQVSVTPRISVPLPATGLTNGATYHILMQQQGGDLNDYLRTTYDHGVFPGNPSLLQSPRDAYTWTAFGSQFAVPLQIFDQTPPAAPGILPWHTWSDQGARISTIVCATTPDQRLLGVCEATRMGLALNANQGFETGVSPWTVTNGTLVQSTAESYSGLHSALVTPNGVASQVSITSELLPCLPGQWVTVSGWSWLSVAVTGNLSLSISWFTVGGTYISSSVNYASSAATTWIDLVNPFQAPTGAYQFAINPALQGSPASSVRWYLDGLMADYTYTGPQQSSVTALEYPGMWPGSTWPPLGSTVLA
jgi:hypothetical protein